MLCTKINLFLLDALQHVRSKQKTISLDDDLVGLIVSFCKEAEEYRF